MKTIKYLLIAGAALTLSACETFDGIVQDFGSLKLPALNEPMTTSEQKQADKLLASECPDVRIMDELSGISEFTNPAYPHEKNMISHADLKLQGASCDLANSSVTVDIKLAFNGILGPRGRINQGDRPFFSYPFFVAVIDPRGEIMGKQIFSASMNYDSKEDSQTHYEDLRQIIPITEKSYARRYRILIGFQLDKQQLAYNRATMLPAQTEPATPSFAAPVNGSASPTQTGEDKPQTMRVISSPAPSDGPIDLTEPAQ